MKIMGLLFMEILYLHNYYHQEVLMLNYLSFIQQILTLIISNLYLFFIVNNLYTISILQNGFMYW